MIRAGLRLLRALNCNLFNLNFQFVIRPLKYCTLSLSMISNMSLIAPKAAGSHSTTHKEHDALHFHHKVARRILHGELVKKCEVKHQKDNVLFLNIKKIKSGVPKYGGPSPGSPALNPPLRMMYK